MRFVRSFLFFGWGRIFEIFQINDHSGKILPSTPELATTFTWTEPLSMVIRECVGTYSQSYVYSTSCFSPHPSLVRMFLFLTCQFKLLPAPWRDLLPFFDAFDKLCWKLFQNLTKRGATQTPFLLAKEINCFFKDPFTMFYSQSITRED